MKTTTTNVLLVCCVLLLSNVASRATFGATWRVEQDGVSGDFSVVQDAIEAAADGDTILIGPGHYQEVHESAYSLPSIVSWDDSRALTIIGSGQDEVLFGPDEPNPDEMGIWYGGDANIHVSGISFQNHKMGILTNGSCEIFNCRFSDSWGGVIKDNEGIGLVSDCEFYHQQFGGAGVGVWGATQFTIEDCYFEDEDIYLQGVPDATVRNCEFNGRVGSFTGSNGVFENNVATISSNKALYVNSGSQVLVQGCEFSVSSTGEANISISEQGTSVELRDSVFYGGPFAAIYIYAAPTVIARGNHFLNEEGGYSVRLQQWSNPVIGMVDFSHNYWGTDNEIEVQQLIWDGMDDPEIAIEVQYLPFSDGPLPTEIQTLGGVKALYRH